MVQQNDLGRLTRGLGSRHYPDAAKVTVRIVAIARDRRIAALIGVIGVALLIYCLIERQARRNLAPATTLDGFYAGRPAKPTASLILTALAPLRLRAATNNGTPEIPQPDALQLRILDLLNIDPWHSPRQAVPPHPNVRITGLAG